VIGCEDFLRHDLYTVSSGALNSTPASQSVTYCGAVVKLFRALNVLVYDSAVISLAFSEGDCFMVA